MIFREITVQDVPELIVLRTTTRENALSMEELNRLDITEKSVRAMIGASHRGWLCESDGRIAGFAMGDRRSGEMWVIALRPEFEGRGIGAELLTRVEDWLWSEGWESIWLTTDLDPNLRAYGFYLRQGWTDWRISDGLRYLQKNRRQP